MKKRDNILEYSINTADALKMVEINKGSLGKKLQVTFLPANEIKGQTTHYCYLQAGHKDFQKLF